jgi:hypothetical protein
MSLVPAGEASMLFDLFIVKTRYMRYYEDIEGCMFAVTHKKTRDVST